jgi:hypothetical protein
MLTFLDRPSPHCEGSNRREFLQIGALAGLGIALPEVLRAEAEQRGGDDLSCIFMWMNGGPSHIDTFDPKPEAPVEIRGEFSAIDTNLPGVQVTEHLPNLAQQMDKYSVIRSGTQYSNSHGVSDHFLMSGYKWTPALVYPCYGSVVARELGWRNSMPPFIQLGTAIDRRFGGGTAGFMGAVYNPFEIDSDPASNKFRVRDVTPPAGIDLARVDRRKRYRDALDTFQQQVEESPDLVESTDSFYEKAFRLVTSPVAKKAFDLSEETDDLRARYGKHRLGQSLLLARRLVEAGVRFVTVTDPGWDTHQNNFNSLKSRLLPRLDQAYSALLVDLAERGMLEKTLVVWTGDFGRTPKVNPSAGRDHWGAASLINMGGGGVKTGRIVGRTNKYAEQPEDNPVQIPDVAATIYTALGIALDRQYHTPDGRPISVNYGGRVIRELL